MREWLSWWSTTLPRSGSRVRVPFFAHLMRAGYVPAFFISFRGIRHNNNTFWAHYLIFVS